MGHLASTLNQEKTLELLVKIPASSPRKAHPPFLTAKSTELPSWQNSFTLLTVIFPTASRGEASKYGPIYQKSRLRPRGK